ncbi:hypothetical protein RND71_005062 [Anisodus tanguticus]|uniref:Major facilitator superfamily (MFS) profile domain-containing protein n=1 Tax=Anisodus tanguticus TaxID=243964 RepID=A0AAE1SQR4_9SOLA|nr:hypothetical protein RND71_005062 [Anisodus tanguticus]
MSSLIANYKEGIMEKAHESLLPGVYEEVGDALHTNPTGLGSLTLFRSMVQSACYPIAAYLAARHNRAHVIAYGAFLWAAATFLVAFSTTFFQLAVSRALNGIGLAIVSPAIQSLVADSCDESNRGVAFGWLQFTSNIGSLVGGYVSLLVAPITVMRIPGWRLSFHLVGMISVLVGVLVRLFANDPHFPDGDLRASSKVHGNNYTFISEIQGLLEEAKSVVKIPSFQIIVAQGVLGSFPWSALSFAPMWLELTGFTHGETAILLSLFVVGDSIGGLFGGRMGDILSQHLPNSGRIILAQISSGSAIPLAAILLLALPDDPSSIFAHGIVPEKARTSIYALDRSFESVLSSFAPPVVGILAQNVYGYRPIARGADSIATDRENATSLAKALFTAIGSPMALCCVVYSFLYCTYPRDKEKAQMEALIESEMQLLPLDPTSSGEYSLVKSSENQESYLDEKPVDDMHFSEVDGLDFEDGNDKTVIYRRPTISKFAE